MLRDPLILGVDEAIDRLNSFDAVLDARSPAEFEHDHLPGARSAPVLDDLERAHVGTVYKQRSGFEAKRIGAALVARNIARLIETDFADKPREWSPLVYCWRGGNRSGSLATVLNRVGWRVVVLEGGYKAFRQRVLNDLETTPAAFDWRVIAGRTGTGKSDLLHALARQGAQVLDLEALARHRGSVLGTEPDAAQPGQKRFETLLWERVRTLDRNRPVFVESESRRIGTCHLPEALMLAMRAAPCLVIEADLATRTALLMSRYQHFIESPALLAQQLPRLREIHGDAVIKRWLKLVESAQWADLVTALLQAHYDPSYDKSMQRNFRRLAQAPRIVLTDPGRESIDHAARSLLDAALGQSRQ